MATTNKQKTIKNKKQSHIFLRFHNLKTAHKILLVLLLFLFAVLSALAIFYFSNDNASENMTPTFTNQTKEKVVVEEEIDFEVVNIDSDEINVNETLVKQEGKKGILEVTYEVVYDSEGKEVSRNKITEKIKELPVTQIIMIGTKQPQPPMNSTPTQYDKNPSNAQNNVPENTAPTPDTTISQPQPVKTYSDAEIISICNNAIVAKFGWALSNGDAGSDDNGPKVTNLGNGKYQVRGFRRTGVWSFVASGCDISDGVVTNILR